MKVFVFVAALIASVAAVPTSVDVESQSNLLIEGLVRQVIENAVSGIKDPVAVENASGDIALWDALSASGTVSGLFASGASNVVVNDVTFNILTGTAAVDLTWPTLSASAGSLVGRVNVLGNELRGTASGSIVFENVGVATSFRISFINSISVSDVSAGVTVGNVDSRLNVALFGKDISNGLNDLLNNRLSSILEIYNDRVVSLVERIINRYL